MYNNEEDNDNDDDVDDDDVSHLLEEDLLEEYQNDNNDEELDKLNDAWLEQSITQLTNDLKTSAIQNHIHQHIINPEWDLLMQSIDIRQHDLTTTALDTIDSLENERWCFPFPHSVEQEQNNNENENENMLSTSNQFGNKMKLLPKDEDNYETKLILAEALEDMILAIEKIHTRSIAGPLILSSSLVLGNLLSVPSTFLVSEFDENSILFKNPSHGNLLLLI